MTMMAQMTMRCSDGLFFLAPQLPLTFSLTDIYTNCSSVVVVPPQTITRILLKESRTAFFL